MIWKGLLGMMAYSALVSVAGLFVSLQDDAQRAGNVPRARACRAVVQVTLLLSILPFMYMVLHFH